MQASTTQTPRTSADLRALRDRREELVDQLESATERRGQLAQERMNARARGDQAMVQEYDASVRELGERVKRLEREVMQADDAISDAISRRVGQGESETQVITIPRIPAIPAIPAIPQIGFPGQIGRRDLTEVHQRYQKMMVAEAAGFILLGALVCRYVWHRAMRKASRLGAAGGDILGLRQSVDAIAVEVERISENQRYVTKLLVERRPDALQQQRAEPVEVAVDRNAPRMRSEP